MQITILIDPLSDSAAIERLARSHCPAGAQVTVTADADAAAGGRNAEDCDLIHVAPGAELPRRRAARFLAGSLAGRVGVLSAAEGLVLSRADRGVFRRFLATGGEQDDTGVYVAGDAIRTAHGSGPVPLPRQVYLGLTQRCNRSCSFCVSRTFAEDMLSVAEVRRIAAQLAGSVDVIALTGAGEAMVHPDFWEILDLLRAAMPEVVFKMNSSGVALRRNARRLLDYPVKNVTVSLNAGTRETYERVVGRGFEAALRGVETLVAERARACRDDLRLCLSLVLMVSTMAEIEQVVRIAFELGVEEVQGIYLMVNDDELADESPWHRQEESNEHLARAAALGRTLGVEVSLPPPFGAGASEADRFQRTSLPTEQGQRCVEPWSTAYIRPDGEVLPCPYFEESMGSLREESLAAVWRGDGFEGLRDGILAGTPREECRHCCGFNECGSVDDYASHWLGTRGSARVGR